jgi:hypothetical protein
MEAMTEGEVSVPLTSLLKPVTFGSLASCKLFSPLLQNTLAYLVGFTLGPWGKCYKTFCHGNLLQFHGIAVILCYKKYYFGNYHRMAVNYYGKELHIILPCRQT